MNKSYEEIVEEMQQVVNQMVLDDLEENPDLVNEYFDCDCCGKINVLPVQFSTATTDYVMIVSCLQKQVLHLANLKIFNRLWMQWKINVWKNFVILLKMKRLEKIL